LPEPRRTIPAHRNGPNATRPAATKVSPRPTTVTWFGVSGVRPSAETSASACRRTHASNRVVNTRHLQCPGRLSGQRFARFLVNLDDLASDQIPGVATCLLLRVVGKPRTEVVVAGKNHKRSGELAPVLRLDRDAVPTRLEHGHVSGHLRRHHRQAGCK